ncbi:ABC transporter permease [uncultured Clostridium sp.]|uniref:ABC transporter permease n=1 Tax=uncultured Clostridium sp. TaxID=59620 RepID=UPI0026005BF1|nr:ABC transporter permease [uncultured Clostridium sp.]
MILRNFISRELHKYKKSPLSFIVILFPIIAGIIATLALYKIYKNVQVDEIWEVLLIGNKIQSIWTLISIALVSVVTSLIVSIDKDNKTYKVIFASIMSKKKYYFEKLLAVCLFIFLIIFLYNISIVIIAKIIFVNRNIEYAYIGKLILKEYILILPIAFIQLYLAMYLKNIIGSIAVGLCGSIMGLGVLQQLPKIALINPYSYPYYSLVKNQDNAPIIYILALALVYLIIFFVLGTKRLVDIDVNEVE